MYRRDWERYFEDVALARYGVIAPLVCRVMTRAELSAELDRTGYLDHRFPDGFKRVSRRSIRRWCKYYQTGRKLKDGTEIPPGLDALRPAIRQDRGNPRVVELEVVNRAVRLREENPCRKTEKLLELLECEAKARQEEPPQVKESTLNYHLRERGCTRRKLKVQKRAFRRFEHPHRNSCWQGDWTDGIWLPHQQNPNKQRKCHLHGLIDDHSRYIVHAEFYFSQGLVCLKDCFRKAVLKGGIPAITYVDRGACYRARQFKLLAGRLGTELILATEYAPEGKGKIERWIRVLKEDFFSEAEHAELTTLEELNPCFWGWLDRRLDRVHSQTRQTPRERWEAGAQGVRLVDPARLVDIFLWEEDRKVDKSGCFQLGGNTYPVAEHLVRETVTLRFDPYGLDLVRVYHNGVLVETTSPQKLVSRTFRKALPRRKGKPAPLESSKLYCKQLSESHHRQTDLTLAQVGSGSSLEDAAYLTEGEWLHLLLERLSRRKLRVHERTLSSQFFRRYAPLPREATRQALDQAVEEKGARLHLRFYLKTVRQVLAQIRKDV